MSTTLGSQISKDDVLCFITPLDAAPIAPNQDINHLHKVINLPPTLAGLDEVLNKIFHEGLTLNTPRFDQEYDRFTYRDAKLERLVRFNHLPSDVKPTKLNVLVREYDADTELMLDAALGVFSMITGNLYNTGNRPVFIQAATPTSTLPGLDLSPITLLQFDIDSFCGMRPVDTLIKNLGDGDM